MHLIVNKYTVEVHFRLSLHAQDHVFAYAHVHTHRTAHKMFDPTESLMEKMTFTAAE